MNDTNLPQTHFAQILLSSVSDRQQVLKDLLAQLISDFQVERGSIWLSDREYVSPLFSLNKDGIEDNISESLREFRLPIGTGFVGLAAQTGLPNHSNSPTQTKEYNTEVDTSTHHQTKNIISIPLVKKGEVTEDGQTFKEDQVIGVVQLLNRVMNVPFTKDDENVLRESYAPWATIALDNANLYKKANDSENFGKKLLGSLHRTNILRELLAMLIQEFHVERGSIWYVDGHHVHALFSLNKVGREDKISHALQGVSVPLGKGFVGIAAQTGEATLSNRPVDNEEHLKDISAVTHHEPRNIMSVPLLLGSTCIGVIQLLDHQANIPFSKEDIKRCEEIYAPWATIALDNFVVDNFGKELLSSLDRKIVLRSLMKKLIQEFRVSRGSIWHIEGNFVVPMFSLNEHGYEDEISQELRTVKIPLGEGFVGIAAQTGKSSFNNKPKGSSPHLERVSEETKHEPQNIMSVPLVRRDRVVGVIQLLDRKDGELFARADQDTMEARYAPWATIAVDNANSYMEIAELTQDLNHYLGGKLGAVLTINEMLKKKLGELLAKVEAKFQNDPEAQQVTALSTRINKYLQVIGPPLEEAIKLTNVNLFAYKDSAPDLVDLHTMINEVINKFDGRDDIVIRNRVSIELPKIKMIKSAMSFHISELLNNAIKAINDGLVTQGITEGEISVEAQIDPRDKMLELRINNNGMTIDCDKWEVIFRKGKTFRKHDAKTSHGRGLWSARTFMERHQGSIVVERSEDNETTFLVKLPC